MPDGPFSTMATLLAFMAIVIVSAAFALVVAVRRMSKALKGRDSTRGFDVLPERPADQRSEVRSEGESH